MAKDKEYYKQFLTNTNVVAYLNAISTIEAPTYYTNFGGGIVTPTSAKHPEVKVCSGSLCSTAFGRYQFMPDTWEEIVAKIGPLDIREPRDQDIAAIYLLDGKRGTLNDVVAGNCIATLNSNSEEWASIPNASSSFAYENQGSRYNAQSFCKLVDSLKGTTLPGGALVNNSSPILNAGAATALSALSPYGAANFSDINCPPIKEEDLYRANYQITNPGCKITGAIQPITGSATNGSTVRSSNGTNTNTGFSVNPQGRGQCSSLRAPVKGFPVTSPFGWRWGRLHKGTDLGCPEGTAVYAACNGKVEYAQHTGECYGNRIEIISPEGILTTYNHLSVIQCSAGQQVTIGQQIALSGNTGCGTGAHLHFEIKIGGGDYIDPESCITFT